MGRHLRGALILIAYSQLWNFMFYTDNNFRDNVVELKFAAKRWK